MMNDIGNRFSSERRTCGGFFFLLLLTVPKLGRKAVLHAAPSDWNLLQLHLKLQVSFREFKSLLKKLYSPFSVCYLGDLQTTLLGGLQSGSFGVIHLLFDSIISFLLTYIDGQMVRLPLGRF